MKKLITLFFICFCGYVAIAQSPLNVGIHAGYVNTKLGTDFPGIKSSGSSGYMLGAFMRVNLGIVYIEPALNFSKKRSDVSYRYEGGRTSGELEYNSMDIPVLLGFHVLKLPLVKLRAFIGPVASFTTKKVQWNDIPEALQKPIDPDKAMWNVKVGAGVDLWKFSLDIDWEKGLKDFQKDVLGKPRFFNATVGFRFL